MEKTGSGRTQGDLCGSPREEPEPEPLIEYLYQNIGRLQVELEWLQKNLVLPLELKQELIEPVNREISIVRQCEFLGLNRSSQRKLT